MYVCAAEDRREEETRVKTKLNRDIDHRCVVCMGESKEIRLVDQHVAVFTFFYLCAVGAALITKIHGHVKGISKETCSW